MHARAALLLLAACGPGLDIPGLTESYCAEWGDLNRHACGCVVARSHGLTSPSPALADDAVPANRAARYVAVCRISWSYERDDVVVDEVAATCM
jgi:hypothetical protein